MKLLTVVLNKKVIKYKQLLPLTDTQEQPILNYIKNDKKLYTIMMIDPDAPDCANPIYKYVLHWLIVNTSDVIKPYHPPSPPAGSGNHRYYIIIYEQSHFIDPLSFNNIERHSFDAYQFVNANNLKPILGNMFMSKHSDTEPAKCEYKKDDKIAIF